MKPYMLVLVGLFSSISFAKFGENGLCRFYPGPDYSVQDAYGIHFDGKSYYVPSQAWVAVVNRYTINSVIDEDCTKFDSDISEGSFSDSYMLSDGSFFQSDESTVFPLKYSYVFARHFLSNGKLDRAFGPDGILQYQPRAGWWPTYRSGALRAQDGSIFTFVPQIEPIPRQNPPVVEFAVSKIKNGKVDNSFVTQSIFDRSVLFQAAYLLKNNKMLVLVTNRNKPRNTMVRLTPTGAVDTTFANRGYLDFPENIHWESLNAFGSYEDTHGNLFIASNGFVLKIKPDGSYEPISIPSVKKNYSPDYVLITSGGDLFTLTQDPAKGNGYRELPMYLKKYDLKGNPKQFGPATGTKILGFKEIWKKHEGALAQDSKGRIVIVLPDLFEKDWQNRLTMVRVLPDGTQDK